jgi:putative molybdopterin biosynthesis protein
VIDRTLVITGSHDLILDVLADMMASNAGDTAYIASTHVGSMAGLIALNQGSCHIAPTHLLDEETGVYNESWIKRIFGENEICLIKGVGRVQGLMVQKGNPLKIKDVKDLLRCRYINRQRGAGTRLFLDYKLKSGGIDPAAINGYEREASNHMAVAAAIQSGSADTGMGIASAAKALDLDFIPLGNEEYDFAARPDFLNLKEMELFIETLKSSGFHAKLEELGGYTWERTGEITIVRGNLK